MSRQRVVYIAFTARKSQQFVPELIRVYKASSYQVAYDWLADIAERYGDGKYPVPGDIGTCIACQVLNPKTEQRWWLERHDVE